MSLFPVTGQSSGYPVYNTSGNMAVAVEAVADSVSDAAIAASLAPGGAIYNMVHTAIAESDAWHVANYHGVNLH